MASRTKPERKVIVFRSLIIAVLFCSLFALPSPVEAGHCGGIFCGAAKKVGKVIGVERRQGRRAARRG